MYTVFLKYPDDNTIFELPFLKASYTDELNKGVNANFSFSKEAIDEICEEYGTDYLFLFTGGLREIYIEKNGTKVYYGVISDMGLGMNDGGYITLNVASLGFFNLFYKRRTAQFRYFDNDDSGDIAWTIIEENQASDAYGDLGITQGASPACKPRQRTFKFDRINEAIIKMSNANLADGFDFDIDNLKKFNVYYPQKGQFRDTIRFDEQNIKVWDYRKPLVMSLTNKVYVIGAGFNEDAQVIERNSADSYKSAFTLLEEVLTERDTAVTENLADKGDRFLLDNQSPISELGITHIDGEPDILDYEVGDSFYFTVEEVNIILQQKRLYKRKVDIDENGLAIVQLDIK